MEPDSVPNTPSIQKLRSEAHRLAEECQKQAAGPEATPIDKEAAEAATLLITLAERKADLVPASLANEKALAFIKWGEQRVRDLENEGLTALLNGKSMPHSMVPDALENIWSEQAKVIAALQQHEWEVWSWACDELAGLKAGQPVDSHLHGEG